jgi:enamine deaminase RidA (YjgF/YER057c/UK114 family)
MPVVPRRSAAQFTARGRCSPVDHTDGQNGFASAPGSATIIVKAQVAPQWLIEIEAVAAAKA